MRKERLYANSQLDAWYKSPPTRRIVEERLYHHKDSPSSIFMLVSVTDDGLMWDYATLTRWEPTPIGDWTLHQTRTL
jgi:hypothetical protein